MNDLHEFQDVVDTIREGMSEVHFDGPSVETGLAPSRPSSGNRATVWVSALAFAVVLAVAAPLLLLTRAQPEAPTGASTPTTAVSQPSPIWPPPLPQAQAPAGATWVCPDVPPSEGDRLLDPAQVPNDLRYLTTSGTGGFGQAWGVHRGQACGRGPALVAVQFTDSGQTSASAVVTVWVETELREIANWNWVDLNPTPTRSGDEINAVDGFTVRYTPETDTAPPFVEMVGVLDGLPVWITSSGLTPPQLALLPAEMTADVVTGQVELANQEFTVVHSEPVAAELIDIIDWYVEIDDPTYTVSSIEVRYEPGFNAYDMAAGWVTYIPVNDTIGRLSRNGGEDGATGQLTWSIAPGIAATIAGDGTTDELIDLAERLALVEPDDPRIPQFQPPPDAP